MIFHRKIVKKQKNRKKSRKISFFMLTREKKRPNIYLLAENSQKLGFMY